MSYNESLNSNSNYPPMSQSQWDSAPFNQSDPENKEFSVLCSQTRSKSTTVLTNDYAPGGSGVDYEPDDEGGYYGSAWQDPDDTSDTNWEAAYHDNDHYTPIQLINLFKESLKRHLETVKELDDCEVGKVVIKRIEHLISECEGWQEDEVEYLEDS